MGNVSLDLLLHFKGANLSSFLQSLVTTCAEEVEEEMDTSGLWWGQAGLWAFGALEALGRAGPDDFPGWPIRDRPTAPDRGPVGGGMHAGDDGAVVMFVFSLWTLQSGVPVTLPEEDKQPCLGAHLAAPLGRALGFRNTR